MFKVQYALCVTSTTQHHICITLTISTSAPTVGLGWEVREKMADCRKCQRFDACYLDNDDCIGFIPKTITNADRIRAMSDEELAAVFDTCPPNKNFKDDKNGCYRDIYGSEDEKDCYRCWLDWLRKEAEVEE